MPIAAVPNYLEQDFSAASPGLRFGLYLSIWTSRQDQEAEVRKRAEAKSKEGEKIKNLLQANGMEQTIAALSDEHFCSQEHLKPLPGIFTKNDFAAKKAWEKLSRLNKQDIEQMQVLLARQRAAFAARAGAEDGLCIEAQATAPFTTGLGNEHPLENGFAFLNPYGLPYLPGSGVKGVIRRAAEELARGEWGERRGWSEEMRYSIEVGTGRDRRKLPLSMLDVLFGREPQSGEGDHVRGALTFWDVIPQIAGNRLMVEIMTPHQSHYYQQKAEPKSGNSATPHDSGQPTPIAFLTVPPESLFIFHVTCDTAHLARLAADLVEPGEGGRPRWQGLVDAAFRHAFRWLGFGAKTAVGYGAMENVTVPAAHAAAADVGTAPFSQAAPENVSREEVWNDARLSYNPGAGEIKAHFSGKTTAGLKGEAAQRLLAELGERADKLKKNKELKNVSVRIRTEGNLIELIGLARKA